jgi:hypothetical protein
MSQKLRQGPLSGALSLRLLKTLAAGPLHRMEQEGCITSDWSLTEDFLAH